MSRPKSTPAHHGNFQFWIDSATQMPTTAATEPGARSIWPVMITNNMPTARISTYE